MADSPDNIIDPAVTDETSDKAGKGAAKRRGSNEPAVANRIAELRELSKRLESELHRFKTVMAAVPDFIYHFDLEGRFTYVNQSLLDLWRKTHEEALGKNFHELDYPPELASKLQRQIQEVIATHRPLKDETSYTSAIGSREYEYIFFPLLAGDGSVEAVAGVTRDITDRRQAEQALRESEARFRAMFEQAHIGIVQIAADGHFLAVNPGACAFGGYTESELLRLTVQDVTHPADLAKEEELTARLIAGEIADYALEKRFVRKDGEVVWGNMTATLVRNAAAQPLYVLAIVEAIGERKSAEEQLRGSEERFRQFAENSADVFWIVDARTQRTEYVNPVYEKIWGESREALLRDTERWFEIVHPEDRDAAKQAMPKVLAGETFVIEYRITRPSDGGVRWIRDTGFPIRDEAGSIHRVAGVAQDVTDDKKRTEALRASEERFRLLVEGARDYAMFLLDPATVITFWSSGAERIFGWTQNEAVGRTGDLIFTPEDRVQDAVETEIETALRDGRAPERRFHLRKDGSRFWADGVLMRLDGESGELRGFAKVARDASDQYAIEDALRHTRDELEQRVVERTQDLLATNNELERTMRQREQLERELLEISEREKRRIGEDLHDMVCQELTATALFLRAAATKVANESPGAAETLNESAQIVNRNVGLARDLARGLQPVELKAAGLKEALRALAAQACESSDIKCHFKAARGVRVPDDKVALHLYRVAQEAVTNAVKHSGAENVLIALDKNEENVCVSVQDDGKGFSPKRRSKGLGLHLMRYRANALGGRLKIEKRRSGGMEITCVIPVKR